MTTIEKVDTKRNSLKDIRKPADSEFQQFFRENPNGMLIIRRKDTIIVDVNPAFLKLTDFNRNQIVGKISTDLRD